jgi:predicted dehydrogenase
MKNNILLVGLGNIGSRHLESLGKLPKKFTIYIHDKNKIKLKKYKKNVNFIFISNLDLIKNLCFKVCIVATTASLRKNLIKKIFSLASIKHWIVEKPIEQSLKNLKIINQITKKNNIWVNTPRRSFLFYKNLKKKIGKKISHVYLTGNIEIACNAVHFIDIISFLINSDVKKIITNNLNKKWIQSKRRGFIDVFGKLIIFYKNGTVFTINTFKKKNIDFEKNYLLKIFTKKNEKYEINETKNLVLKNSQRKKTKILQYQSQITKKFVLELLNYNKCELPRLKKVICNHQILLSSLIRHYNVCYKKKINSIKIT